MNFQFLYSGDPSNSTRFSSRSIPSHLTFLVCLLSASTVISTLYALSLVDQQLVLYLRSVHSPLLETIGRVGNRLGDAATLILISLVILGVGYLLKHQRLMLAGLQTLLAHGIAGIVTQIIKHLLGRPRPRMMHQDPFQFGPSLQGGLDAFPSGHASATFAIATVLANYFPRSKVLWYGAAWFVALCRIARGSHYPTDVLAGALLGYLVGFLLIHHLKDWRSSLLTALTNGLPWMVASFSMGWIILHRQDTSLLQFLMLWSGVLIVFLGLGIRVFPLLVQQPSNLGDRVRPPYGLLLICAGLALSTETLLIVVLACLSLIPWVIMNSYPISLSAPYDVPSPTMSNTKNAWKMAQEAMVAVTIFLLLILIQHMKGLLPLA